MNSRSVLLLRGGWPLLGRVPHQATTHTTHEQFLVDVSVNSTNPPMSLSVLIDSGSAGNFILASLVSSLALPLKEIAKPISVQAPDGQVVSKMFVTHITRPLSIFFTQPAHIKQIQFYVLVYALPTIVLGLPWLRKHNPVIDWCNARIKAWSSQCAMNCQHPNFLLNSTTIEKPLAHFPVQTLPVHPLSLTKTKAMEEYVTKALKQGIIM